MPRQSELKLKELEKKFS